MRPAQKRVVYVSLAATIAAIFIAGLIAGWVDRKSSICPDGRPPVAQSDSGALSDVLYRCHDGRTVTNNG